MSYQVAVINAGSSSIKFAVFDCDTEQRLRFRGQIEKLGVGPRLSVEDPDGETLAENEWPAQALDHRSATKIILQMAVTLLGGEAVEAIGHRVVHGGTSFTSPTRVTRAVIESLKALSPLAPLHQPHNLSAIEAIASEAPHIPQVACFDTAFHADLPPATRLLPIPRRYAARGVRRYGFHGLSYAYLRDALARLDPAAARGRVVFAHLGNGCSLAALRDGRCVDTTMALTPAAGLVMGTRSGDLDPGLAAYLARVDGLDAAGFDALVNGQSGLLGLSETSADMRDLLAAEAADPRAAEALAVFCLSARKHIAAMAASLEGLDTLVFAGGIGEHAAPIRARICAGLAHLGVRLDDARNGAHAPVLSAADSRVTVRIIATDEEHQIARETAALLGA